MECAMCGDEVTYDGMVVCDSCAGYTLDYLYPNKPVDNDEEENNE